MFSHLRDWRELRGWSVRDAAERTGMSLRSLVDIEAGRVTRPHPRTQRKLAEAFGITITEFDEAPPKLPRKYSECSAEVQADLLDRLYSCVFVQRENAEDESVADADAAADLAAVIQRTQRYPKGHVRRVIDYLTEVQKHL